MDRQPRKLLAEDLAGVLAGLDAHQQVVVANQVEKPNAVLRDQRSQAFKEPRVNVDHTLKDLGAPLANCFRLPALPRPQGRLLPPPRGLEKLKDIPKQNEGDLRDSRAPRPPTGEIQSTDESLQRNRELAWGIFQVKVADE